MAGVEFKKLGASSLGEMNVHFDNDIRGDERVNHSNKTINHELTHLNYYLGVNSYNELCEKTKKIVKDTDEINPPKRLRQDRKVYFSLEVPCPPELEGTDQEDIFYEKVFKMYYRYNPGLIGGIIHKDEKHEYFDKKKGEICTSRNHVHMIGACLTLDGRINAKDCINKPLCQKVNDDIQKLCLEEWGISFQTGEGRTGVKKSVEELKQESHVALQTKLAKENLLVIPKLREEKKSLVKENQSLASENQDLATENQNLLGQNKTLASEKETLANEIVLKKSTAEVLDDALKNLFTRFNKAYIQVTKIFDHWTETEFDLYQEILDKTQPCIKTCRKSMDILSKYNEDIVFGKKRVTQETKDKVDSAAIDLRDSTVALEEIVEEYGR